MLEDDDDVESIPRFIVNPPAFNVSSIYFLIKCMVNDCFFFNMSSPFVNAIKKLITRPDGAVNRLLTTL